MHKIVPKSAPTCFNMFWGNFSKKFFVQCSMEGRVFEMFLKKIKKFSKFQKRAKSFPNCPKVFWICFGVNFSKIFLPSVPWSVECSKWFQKIKKFTKFQKCRKSFPICPNVFWTSFGVIFSKFFLPSVPWSVECSKWFQKIKKFAKFQKCRKSFPKVSTRVFNMLWGNSFEKFFCPVFHGGSSLRNVFN